MDFGLIAPALIGVVVAIVGFVIAAWMNANRPTLELPPREDDQQQLPFDLDKAGRQTRYSFNYQIDQAEDARVN
ncbi:hypothetical protein [Sphingomonas edaphi]|uniref:Uncharacterized protein n=1 Tax=Sphingomonas edaphi TaxID=2315689 RepID=A0A418Q350_9SPHN|nr:hypothetical protein [Sphingomonas edaphi]RIX32263.1 hypothetical protein D3M59_04690 [Sphingomonas edaphi]